MSEVTQEDTDCLERLQAVTTDGFTGGYILHDEGLDLIAAHRIAAIATERERCRGIAKTGWVSADYNTVGIADADVCMRLCEHIEAAIAAAKGDDDANTI